MEVAHGLDHDTSNPPYVTLGDAMYANNVAKVMELHDA